MNYFAHGYRYLDRPYFLAGTAVPDWLSVVDRRVRAGSRAAARFVSAEDPRLAAIAGGIVQHHRDDAWFHATPAFARLTLQCTREIRQLFPADTSFRPSFLGHLLVEMLLDQELISDDPGRLEAYYHVLDALDPAEIGRAVNRLATRPTELLEAFIPRFSAERFLYDYSQDGKLLARLNRVLRRVGMPQLPESFGDFLPRVRDSVRQHKTGLLDGG